MLSQKDEKVNEGAKKINKIKDFYVFVQLHVTIGDMIGRTYIHDHRVHYEDDAEEAMRHLRDSLSGDEAEVFFAYARENEKGSKFQHDGRNYRLTKDYDGDFYLLERRDD